MNVVIEDHFKVIARLKNYNCNYTGYTKARSNGWTMMGCSKYIPIQRNDITSNKHVARTPTFFFTSSVLLIATFANKFQVGLQAMANILYQIYMWFVNVRQAAHASHVSLPMLSRCDTDIYVFLSNMTAQYKLLLYDIVGGTGSPNTCWYSRCNRSAWQNTNCGERQVQKRSKINVAHVLSCR